MAIFSKRPLLAVVLCGSAGAALAAETTTDPGHCEVVSNEGSVVVIVCDPGTTPEQWVIAATTACGFKTRCNAWIWDDPAKAPDNAPALDSQIPKATAAAALAVWANDSRSLLTIRKPKSGSTQEQAR